MHEELKTNIRNFPKRPGVYLFRERAGKLLYVGKALSLYDRIKSYFSKSVTSKTEKLVNEATRIEYIETGSEFEALLLEANLIKQHQPKFNLALRDGKSYLYIYITTKVKYPKVYLTRKPQPGIRNDGNGKDATEGEFFGPFPSAQDARDLLKMLRRIFPFCMQKSERSICFYHHLHLCYPCPAEIVKEVDTGRRRRLSLAYRTNIKTLVRVLNGNIRAVRDDLTKRMLKYGRETKFEEAQHIKEQIRLIDMLTENRDISHYLTNSNFLYSRNIQTLKDLANVLKQYFPKITKITRIECYDISTLQGKSSAGSQIVFINGLPEKSHYRRYRISNQDTADDYHMLKKVISRRLTHLDWPIPDLIVVDGGKPQVSAVVETLTETGHLIPVIGLAKRYEEIIIPQLLSFKLLRLPREDPVLKLLQSMRDEAHRFAYLYHKKQRHSLTRL